MTQSKTKNLIERQDSLEVMIEALMGNIDKLSIEMIWRHDIPSREGKEVKMSTRRALSPQGENVAENFDDDKEDNLVNH